MKLEIELKEPECGAEVAFLAAVSTMRAKFDFGEVTATRGVMENFRQPFVILCLARHRMGDWGDLDDEDKRMNDLSLTCKGRLLSAYHAPNGEKLYVITEAQHSVTTVLMPDEY